MYKLRLESLVLVVVVIKTLNNSNNLQLLFTVGLGLPLDGIASAIWYSSTSDIAMGGQFSMTKV